MNVWVEWNGNLRSCATLNFSVERGGVSRDASFPHIFSYQRHESIIPCFARGVEQRVERHHVRFETARPKVFNGGKGLPGQASSPKRLQKSIVRCNLQQSRRISSQQGHGGIGKQWPLMHAERSLGGHHPRCYMPLVHGKFEELSSLYRAAACGKHIE